MNNVFLILHTYYSSALSAVSGAVLTSYTEKDTSICLSLSLSLSLEGNRNKMEEK